MKICLCSSTCLVLALAVLAQGVSQAKLVCQIYDKYKCEELGKKCNGTELCEFCYATWTNESGQPVELIHKGCWNQNDSCGNAECIGKRSTKKHFFCCCTGDYCNKETYAGPAGPFITTPAVTGFTDGPSGGLPTSLTPAEKGTTNHHRALKTLLYAVVPIVAVLVILVILFCLYRSHKATYSAGMEEEPLNSNSGPPPSPILCVRPIQLVEAIAQGQFGTVWKANFLKEIVAVKIFPMQERMAWSNEHEFYSACNLNHVNILRFIAAEKHTDENHYTEFWLVTEYHELGSLAGYLKSHTITWCELCKLARTMATGLAYLHSETQCEQYKPCIAHRDVKSKNILVKSDLSCCLSDFGLSMKFESGTNPGEMHGQVGTRRYMAPEVLEGAITFTRDAFLHIDVYALSLVLWEMAGRCTAASGPIEEYKVPFEDEVGLHPSLEDMQQVVVQKKMRPKLKSEWSVHPGMESLLQTIEECWDQDADARLTAECVAERMKQATNPSPIGLEQVPTVTSVRNNTEKSTSSMESAI